ncbi:MAG TPA: S41 family peptidase [Acidimicrobiales bacterium]|nr:S41 family peptidase [Acidimicrobiales bacterium]
MTFPTEPAEPAADAAPEATAEPAAPEATAEPSDPPATDPAPSTRAAASTGTTGRSRRRNGTLIVAGALVAVLAGTVLFLSGWTLGRQTALTPGTPVSEAEAWQPFWDTYSAVTERYAGIPVPRDQLIEGAIKGMIAALNDPFSQYLTPDEFKASLQGISGQFSGIGTTIGTVDAGGTNASCSPLSTICRLAIESVIPGSPAEKAGLRPGDVIAGINGATVDGMTVDQATQQVRGAKGTTVTLSIVRGTAPPFSVAIVRANILQPEVSTKSLAGGAVGYIKLAGFSDQASVDFAAAVGADVKAGQKALVIDLRGNPGGFVTAARDIASQFLASGTVFWEQDAAGNQTQVVVEPGGAATDPAIKLVVLVDGGTASASEIVSAALHDNGRATLVGSKTYGKGTVQQWTQLEGDSGGFRLTIARWLTPDKVWIHGVGITPDVVVASQPTKPGQDPVLDAGLQALGFGAGA